MPKTANSEKIRLRHLTRGGVGRGGIAFGVASIVMLVSTVSVWILRGLGA